MACFLILGGHEFKSQLKGYENVRAQCANCGNWNTRCVSRWPWFTACFIPILPLATHKYKDLECYTCNFHQALKHRPEIQPNGGQGQGQGQEQGHVMQGYPVQNPNQNQGWNQGHGGPGGPGGGPQGAAGSYYGQK